MEESRTPLVIAIVLLLLPVLYIGSYFIALQPTANLAAVNMYLAKGQSASYYRFGGEWSRRGYWPLEWVDRKLRPATWARIDPPAVQWLDPVLLNGHLELESPLSDSAENLTEG